MGHFKFALFAEITIILLSKIGHGERNHFEAEEMTQNQKCPLKQQAANQQALKLIPGSS